MLPLLFWLAGALAHAHPFDGRLYGHKLHVSVDGDALTVDYDAEVPTVDAIADLRAHAGGAPLDASTEASWRARAVAALAQGIRVRTDRGDVPLRATDRGSAAGDTRTVAFRLRLDGTLPPGAQAVGLVNANHLERPAVFSTTLQVDDGLRLDACTLFRVEGGRILRDSSGDWISEESARDLRFSFRRWPGALAGARRVWRRLVEPAPESSLRSARAALSGVAQDDLALLARSGPDAEGLGALALGGAASALWVAFWGAGAVVSARAAHRLPRGLALLGGVLLGWAGVALGVPRLGILACALAAWAAASRWSALGAAGAGLLGVACLRTAGAEALPRGDGAVLVAVSVGLMAVLAVAFLAPSPRGGMALAWRRAAAAAAVLGGILSELLDSGKGVQ